MSASRDAIALAGAVEQLLTALVQRRSVLGDVDPSPLSTFQAITLGVLADSGPLRLGTLAELLHTTDATASRTIDTLSAHGLAERSDDPTDGRGVLVSATAAGSEAVVRRRDNLGRLLDDLVGDMGPAEGRRLTELLGEISALLTGRDA